MTQRAKTVFTIGHSNHAIGTFLTLLGDHRIEALADVRRFPSSRYSPHFNQNMLARSLVEAGISYHHMVSLGGRREGKNAGLASYSNYTITEQFQIDLIHIEELSLTNRVAVMIADSSPMRWKRAASRSSTYWGRARIARPNDPRRSPASDESSTDSDQRRQVKPASPAAVDSNGRPGRRHSPLEPHAGSIFPRPPGSGTCPARCPCAFRRAGAASDPPWGDRDCRSWGRVRRSAPRRPWSQFPSESAPCRRR